jgi:putative transposase
MCRQLEVSRSGYHAWVRRPESRRALKDKAVALEVAAIFEENKSRYGSPRVHREMRARGQWVGRKRVARLMRAGGLVARKPARFVQTTDSNHGHPVAPNVLD